jgi:hypothetical protein
MIYVKRTGEATSQKVLASFLKRVKKFNLVARKRKTKYHLKKTSALQQHRKAIRKARYLEEITKGSKLAKKI